MGKYDVYTISKYNPTDYLIITKTERYQYNGETGKYNFKLMIKPNIIKNETDII